MDKEATGTGSAISSGVGGSELEGAAVIVSKYSAAAAAAGVLPFPLIDLAAIAGIQLKMVHSLSNLYGVPFRRDWAKSLLGSLTGSVTSAGLGRMGLGSALKLIPGVGHLASFLAMPGVAALTTSTLGQIFTRHFESGGTLLDLNLKIWRPIYQEKVQVVEPKN